MDLKKVFYASDVYIMIILIIIMCGLFVSLTASFICLFLLPDRFTSSSPYVALLLLLLSQIYFFIVLGSNALTVRLVSSQRDKKDRSFVLPVFRFGKI